MDEDDKEVTEIVVKSFFSLIQKLMSDIEAEININRYRNEEHS